MANKSGPKGKPMPLGKSEAPPATKIKGEKVPPAAKAKGKGMGSCK